jgi:glycosyltransferase involved in cell wall biosynthesis
MVPKRDTESIVVSSTVFQCLGSGCPIVIPDVKYVERLNKEVVKFKGRDDLKEKVSKLIEDENFRDEILEAAERYANRNSAENIAEKLIKVFEDL